MPQELGGVAARDRYVIRLSTGQWYQGWDEYGDVRLTEVPGQARVFEDVAELSEVLEWLEHSDLDYGLLAIR